MTIHTLKTIPPYFKAILNDTKKFEIRKNDRYFKVGDILILAEYSMVNQKYTGRELTRVVTYITDYQQKEGYIVMSLEKEKE